jgi:hypothetical protein
MFGRSKNFYGLRGFKLNVAIAVIAGTDFALFGYDQVGQLEYTLRVKMLTPR